ncbi:hypothetical protein [Dethiobacter alkaliphilus]|uniref:hypothetical protein n=1 Tax=Dethiobacter alkaliphilus TaxID=427926 RepID=UPI00222778DD|nr:hypothetical protein [Dethiobacter alkaliphilus]MCW3490613.1 hypothetical protein [Dethiobacter alkaliphilus]
MYSSTSFYEKEDSAENKHSVQEEAPLQQDTNPSSPPEALTQPQENTDDGRKVSAQEMATQPELPPEEPAYLKSEKKGITAEIALDKMFKIYVKAKKNK